MSLSNCIIEIPIILLLRYTFYQEYCTSYTKVLIFYADKLMVMGNLKNSSVFNFAILLKSRKSDARERYMFYSKSISTYTVSFHPSYFVTKKNKTLSSHSTKTAAATLLRKLTNTMILLFTEILLMQKRF